MPSLMAIRLFRLLHKNMVNDIVIPIKEIVHYVEIIAGHQLKTLKNSG